MRWMTDQIMGLRGSTGIPGKESMKTPNRHYTSGKKRAVVDRSYRMPRGEK